MKFIILATLALISFSAFSQSYDDKYSEGYRELTQKEEANHSRVINKYEKSGVLITCGMGSGLIDGYMDGYIVDYNATESNEETHYFKNEKGESCRVTYKKDIVER